MAGRKPLLTLELANEIVHSLTLGMSITDTVEEVGISDQSYENWVNKGERLSHRDPEKLTPEEALYVGFFGRCKAARAKGKKNLMKEMDWICLNRKHPKQAYMLAWAMERRWPKEFGRRSIRLEFDEPLTLDTPGGSVPSATCNIIVEGGPVPDAGPIMDEPEETP